MDQLTAYWHGNHWCLTDPRYRGEGPCDRIYTKAEVNEYGAKMLQKMKGKSDV